MFGREQRRKGLCRLDVPAAPSYLGDAYSIRVQRFEASVWQPSGPGDFGLREEGQEHALMIASQEGHACGKPRRQTRKHTFGIRAPSNVVAEKDDMGARAREVLEIKEDQVCHLTQEIGSPMHVAYGVEASAVGRTGPQR